MNKHFKKSTFRFILAGAVAFSVLSAHVVDAVIVEPGFEVETITGGLVLPTTIAFSPDGRIFIAEKGGTVRVVQDGVLLPEPVITLTDINTFADHGLIGMATDPNFLTNGYLYLSYTYENTPGANFGGPKTGRIVRVTVVGNTASESSKVVLVGTVGGNATTPSCADFAVTADCIPSDSPSHSVGGLRFGPDGKLYATLGDGAHFDFPDPKSFNAQILDSLAGKVLRINSDGTAPSDNPFYNGDPTANRSKVFALGVRNAFRFNFQPATGAFFLGDVGWSSWEEIDLVTAGANYGWPCREGDVATTHNCTPTSAATNPLYTYAHDSAGAGSVTAGAFPANGAYPVQYDTTFFIGDYAQNWIKRLVLDANNNVVSIQDFMDDPNGPVDISTGPDGAIYYLAIYTGELNRLTHTTGNRRPVPVISANPTAGVLPLTVAFSSAGSADPDNDSLTYAWNFGDGSVSNQPNPAHTYTIAGTYNAVLTLTDNHGSAASKSIPITAGNQQPQASITNPASGSLYMPFEVIQLNGTGTDLEDGALPASAFNWQIILHHNTHIHYMETFSGTKNPTFIAPDHEGGDIYTEVVLTVTDANGLTGTRSINLYRNNGSQAGNLISNPSAEIEGSSPELPLDWVTGWYGTMNPIFTYPVAGFEGAKAMKLEIIDYLEGNAKWYFSPVFVTPGRDYLFSSYYTANIPTTQTAQFGLPDGTYQYVQISALPAASTPTRVERTITIPAGVETLSVFHELGGLGTITVDDYSLTLVNPGDTTPPNVAVTAPTAGETVSGTKVVTVDASDIIGVSGVTFLIDGVAVSSEDTEAPYAFAWSTASVANGTHTVSARARDAAGNTAIAMPISVTVANTSSTTNLILNPSLETAGANGDPQNWFRGGWGTNTRVFTYPVAGVDGASAAKVEITSYTDGDAKWYFADVPVTAGTPYLFSHKYKSAVETQILARYTLAGGSFQYQSLGTLPATAGWTATSYTLTPPATATSMTIFHVINSVGSLEVDTFSLVDNSTPPPPAVNLILNGSFEIADGANPQGWTPGGWGTNTRVHTYPILGSDGNKAARLEITAYPPTGTGDAKWVHTEVPVTPGTQYTYSDRYRSNTISDVIGRYRLDNGAFHYFGLAKEIQPTTTWQTVSAAFIPPVNATHVTFFHLISSVGFFELDNVDMRESGTGPPSETEPPIVEFTNPLAGQTVSGSITLTASSTDNVAVTYIFYAVDGIPITGQITEPPYAFTWDTTSVPNGNHTLKATTHDPSGNNSTHTIVITVNNTPPPVSSLIANHSLETVGANGDPQNWFRGGWGTNTRTFTYPVAGADGANGAKVEVINFVNGDAKWYFADVPVTGGQSYTLTHAYKSTVNTGMTARYTLANGAIQYVSIASEASLTPSATWRTVTHTFVAPSTAVSMTMFHTINANGILEVDNYVLSTGAGSSFTNGMVSLTFDDGWMSHYTEALPILNAANMQGVFYIISNRTLNITPPELIANSSFETVGANGDPQNWFRGGWGTNTRVFTYPVAGVDGASAAKVEITSYTDGDAKWYFADVPVLANNEYVFSNQYNSTVASTIVLRYTFANGSVGYANLGSLPSTGGTWQTFSKTFITPADVASVTAFHLISQVGSLSIDTYSLRDVPNYVDPSQVLEMQAAGHEIGSHTRTHPSLTSIPVAEAQVEIEDSKPELLGMGVTVVDTIAYPLGDYNAAIKTMTQNAGYTAGRSVDRGYNTKASDRYALKIQQADRTTTLADVQNWVAQAQADKTWLIIMFHQIDNDFNNPESPIGISPALFQQIVNHIDTSGIEVVSMREGAARMNP